MICRLYYYHYLLSLEQMIRPIHTILFVVFQLLRILSRRKLQDTFSDHNLQRRQITHHFRYVPAIRNFAYLLLSAQIRPLFLLRVSQKWKNYFFLCLVYCMITSKAKSKISLCSALTAAVRQKVNFSSKFQSSFSSVEEE